MTTVLLIDDHPLIADGVISMLRTDSSIDVLGVARTGENAIDFLKNETPDVILLDVHLPDTDGLKLCESIVAMKTASKVLMLTSVTDAAIISQALSRGASGYLVKDIERKELLSAIDTVLGGKIFVSATANEKLLESYRSDADATRQIVLTRREKEVLDLLDKGLNGPQIAKNLFLSNYTVETHRKNLMQKLESNTTQMLLKKAREYKLTQD